MNKLSEVLVRKSSGGSDDRSAASFVSLIHLFVFLRFCLFSVGVSEVGLAKVSWLVELRWDDGGAG